MADAHLHAGEYPPPVLDELRDQARAGGGRRGDTDGAGCAPEVHVYDESYAIGGSDARTGVRQELLAERGERQAGLAVEDLAADGLLQRPDRIGESGLRGSVLVSGCTEPARIVHGQEGAQLSEGDVRKETL